MQARWTELGKAKLGSSGLDTKQAETLGMYEVASAKQVHPHLDARPALIMPYMDLKGKPAKSHPTWPDFFRARYLDKGSGFAAMATEKGDQRYAQPPRTGVCAYFPTLIDWSAIADDTSTPILITEGELKAAAGSAEGWATIGLGGVWNFRASSEGFFFLPELERIQWSRRQVYVVFDSDFVEKPSVCFAINALASELVERGALPYVTTLPDVYEDDRKTGLDDFLLESKPGDLERLLEESQPVSMARALWRMNNGVAYVQNPGMIVQLDDGLKMTPGAFKEHSVWSTAVTSEQKIDNEGNLTHKKVPAAPNWLKWPLRRTVKKVTYAPGLPRVTEDNLFNQWAGWGVQPSRGNVKPFLDLVKFIFKDMEPEMMDWFLDWCAYPIQNPGTKMASCVVVWGAAEGTGKSLVGYTLGQIYGENFKELTDDDLEGDYTAWAENRQFVLGDEITGSDNRQYANKLKRLITQRKITINVKFVPQYEVPDCINYYFTSNHADAFFMSDKDRRMFIVEVQGDPLSDTFYAEYDKWLWGTGPAHLMQWMMDRPISKKFNPMAKPPVTSAKQRMIKAGKGELTGWISDLLEAPAQVLVTGKMRHTRDLYTSAELLNFYKAQHPDAKATAIGLGKQLSNAGVRQVAGGDPIRSPDGTQGRYYAIRNRDRWDKCTDRKKLEAELKKGPVPKTGTEGKV